MSTLGPTIIPGFFNVLLLTFLFWLVSRNRILSPWRTRRYKEALLLTMLMLIAENFTLIADAGGPAWRMVNLLCNAVGFGLSPLLPVLLASVHMEKPRSKLPLLFPQIFCAVAAFLSPVTGWIFSVSAENIYSRGPYFFVYVLSYLYSLGVLVVFTFHQTKNADRASRRFFLCLCATVLLGTSFQVIWPTIHTTWLSVTFILALYYLYQRELQFQYDILTGLLNREAFQRDFDMLADRPSVLVMILDVDLFKDVNDHHGHVAGDHCLQTMALAIKQNMGVLGQCFRIGGDEFCILGHGCPIERIDACRKALDDSLAKLRNADPTLPTISCGYAIIPGNRLEYGWQLADQALYADKAAHRSPARDVPSKGTDLLPPRF